jgi:ACS family hexuronate transporter-like MFS transporter
MLAYAAGQSLFGRIIDVIGTRLGFVFSILIWSLSIVGHALVRSLGLISLLRVTLGVSEAGNWPGAVKAGSLWFPSRERALALGVFNSGASIGAIVSAPLVALLFGAFGWRATFAVVGVLGLLWLVPWLWLYRGDPDRHPWLSAAERAYILDGAAEAAPAATMRVGRLLRHRESWAVIAARFFLDPIWWLFVSWLPIYLAETFGFDVAQIGLFAWVPYVGAMLGSLGGGWLSGAMVRRGWRVPLARKSVVTLGGAIMLPALLLTTTAATPLVAVLLIAAVLFGFQVAINNIQTLPGDYFAGGAVATLTGISGTAAVAGTLITTWLVPAMTRHSYAPIFILAAAIVPLGVLAVWLLAGSRAPLSTPNEEGMHA